MAGALEPQPTWGGKDDIFFTLAGILISVQLEFWVRMLRKNRCGHKHLPTQSHAHSSTEVVWGLKQVGIFPPLSRRLCFALKRCQTCPYTSLRIDWLLAVDEEERVKVCQVALKWLELYGNEGDEVFFLDGGKLPSLQTSVPHMAGMADRGWRLLVKY
ncbi:hypothetical protein GHT06_014366 [Daphnia sinensis]|uniref:Uncharacterized protein n=1 Tax=Daphnia sinensis TaxID=1820382 RepID=A0AAD5KVI8_9CRUS|nr:hypothetical protein GHT06_014366 [Daphnia sinensis]